MKISHENKNRVIIKSEPLASLITKSEPNYKVGTNGDVYSTYRVVYCNGSDFVTSRGSRSSRGSPPLQFF